MSSMFSGIGLRAGGDASNTAPYHLMFNFMWAYVILSTRFAKQSMKIDHNTSPREDTAKYGERAVKEGKLTQRQLNFLKRNEGAHANSMEHFSVIAAAALFATVAGVPNAHINGACAVYTAARIVFAVSYLVVEKVQYTYIRSLAWWVSNFICLNLLWSAGKALNTAK